MKGSRELRGALILARCTPSPFTREELDLLTAMAYRIALTLEQIKNTNQLKHIIQGNQKIGHHLEESGIGEEAVQAFPVIVSADAAVLYRCNDDFNIICTSVPENNNKERTAMVVLGEAIEQRSDNIAGRSCFHH